ncbi:MAG: GH92 family glycosyl hydrolase [Cryomorphaceae bacterium]
MALPRMLACASLGLLLFGCSQQRTPADWVNPFVGTDFNGHTFPGATLPFGMVQLSPDTRIDGSWEGCSGYHYSDSIIYGFSHTHLSGTGVSDYGDVLLMPQVGEASFVQTEYASAFAHADEKAEPGYYEVLMSNGIKAELTATTRVGMHRYTFPKSTCSMVLDLNHRDPLTEGRIRIVNERTVAVGRRSNAWARDQHAYAFIVFNQPFDPVFNSDSTKVIFRFGDVVSVMAKVGLSFTDEEGAQRNLEAELPGWDFDQVRNEAKRAWNDQLGKIDVRDDSEEKTATFYTALYHTMIHPNVAMDVDGRYRGMDNKLHRAEGFVYYTVFSLWDTFRALHPLFNLIERERTRDFIHTFLAMYRQGGRLPVWELCSNETDCMIGYHSVSVMADALAKGIDDFDQELALEAMQKSATWDHLGLPAYRRQGFLAIDDEHESVSKTLEYAYDDWCIAQVAHRLGDEDIEERYMQRSHAWRNLLDPTTRLMRPRSNGGWLTPFDPREVNNHFTEGNAWQYSFFVPHDIPGMIESMGGKAAFENKLDALFKAPELTTGRTQADITGLIGQYAHGNEPSHHMAYLYNFIDRPEKTEERVHQILREFYSARPDGLIGNEDCGQMSAWYVMSSMGIYAVTPGRPEYALVAPYLDDFTVHLENGSSFDRQRITDALKESLFIAYASLTQMQETEPLDQPGIYEHSYLQSPVISAGSLSFDDSMHVSISVADGQSVYHSFMNADSTFSEARTDTSFWIYESRTIVAHTAKGEGAERRVSSPVTARFYKNPHPHWNVELQSNYNPQYSAGGEQGLIDGIRGDENWRKGYWQGYQDQDLECVIDFSGTQLIQSLSVGCLQDTRSWILMPTKVEFYTSTNGRDFELVATVSNTVQDKDYEVQVKDFSVRLSSPLATGFLKVKAYNYGTLPTWHQGHGGEAFIFVDEIGVE